MFSAGPQDSLDKQFFGEAHVNNFEFFSASSFPNRSDALASPLESLPTQWQTV
jgi:hypothetical protein